MTKALRVLMIDDSEDDVLLTLRELRTAGYAITSRRVDTPDAVREAFASPWDFVISDWHMPDGFTGLVAFQIMRERGLDIPFIITSGTIGEELAVEALKAGVHDFLIKGKYARLVPTVERELREAARRQREREIEATVARQRHELEQSERLLRDIIDTVPDGVIVFDTSWAMRIHNAAAAHMLDLSESTTTNWEAHLELYAADMTTQVGRDDMVIARAFRGEAVDRVEKFVRMRGRDKGLWVNVSARPLYDGGEIWGALLVVRDMTRERAAQEQLMISDRMASIGMLAAGVAHELNNPLAAVIANLELMQEVVGEQPVLAGRDLEETREMLGDARLASDRVRQIVRDLKIFARHEDTTTAAVELQAMLESTLRMAWNEIRHRARLEKRYGETKPVRGTESRLGQVFLNLIVNAAQAIPEGNAGAHVIRIATGMEDEHTAYVEVTDDGIGMSAETQRNLFTPFFTTKRQSEGTGLGLAISHRIVAGLGGSIHVASTLGRGTTFRVCLPVTESAASTRRRTTSQNPGGRRGRILIIDDEAMIANVICRMLANAHDVELTTDAAVALTRLDEQAFDVILCDVMMPQMTGMEFYERATATHPEVARRIVFMTGEAFTEAARAFLDRISNPRLEKPFVASALRGLIRELVAARDAAS